MDYSDVIAVHSGCAATFCVAHFPWNDGGYQPKTTVTFGCDDKNLYLRFDVSGDIDVRAECKNYQDSVCNDSCVEFFANFKPDEQAEYLNFEINSIGATRLMFGAGRQGRVPVPIEDYSLLAINTAVNGENWHACLTIPEEFIVKFYPNFNIVNANIKCNFYKCADAAKQPHYACWSYIDTPKPDFHRPEFFGEILIRGNIK